jgi:hypothetical protein
VAVRPVRRRGDVGRRRAGGGHGQQRDPALRVRLDERGGRDGTPGLTADGDFAIHAELGSPVGVAATAEGGFVVAELDHQRVREVSKSGVLRTIAGTGDIGPAPAARRARRSPLAWPAGVATLPDGDVLIADTNAHAVLRVDAEGDLVKVAGARRRVSARSAVALTAALRTYLTQKPLDVRRKCRLTIHYQTSQAATGYLVRGNGDELWHGPITYPGGTVKTGAITLANNTYTVWFYGRRSGGAKSPGDDAKLKVHGPKC